MDKSALDKQVAWERAAIENAAPVAYGPTIPRCHFCGRIVSGNLYPAHDALPVNGTTVMIAERFKGGCCNGHAH